MPVIKVKDLAYGRLRAPDLDPYGHSDTKDSVGAYASAALAKGL